MGTHIYIILLSLPFSILLGVAAGILVARRPRLRKIVIGVANVLMTVPSLALFGFAIILLSPINAGIGVPPAIFALIIYSLLPIIRNTVLALHSVSSGVVEAAKGMGMSSPQILLKIQLPLALPLLMAGVRNAVVMGVSVTTIAYLVGAQGLGYFLFAGLSRTRSDMVILGAVLVAILGIGANYLLFRLENVLTPKGVKLQQGV
ncbi:MAG: ABC transporter permease, partial [Spirochaetales bacterium]|nr:ABC transporter permease [Spirochaetales bacterium]